MSKDRQWFILGFEIFLTAAVGGFIGYGVDLLLGCGRPIGLVAGFIVGVGMSILNVYFYLARED